MIAIFDVEGVLVDGEFLPELARLVGKEEEVRDITMKGIRGEISWEHGQAVPSNMLMPLVTETRKRKGLPPEPPTAEEFIDKE